MRWVRWGVRTLLWSAAVLVVLAVAAVFFLTRTGPGVRWTVGQAVERMGAGIQGSVEVEGVEAADLLEGALLLGVEIRDTDDRLFARADSLRIEYSVPALLRGDVVLDEVDARGLSVVVERLPGRQESNLTRIFASDAMEPDTARSQPRAGADRTILLRDVRIARGRVELRMPVEEGVPIPEGAYTEPAPGNGGTLRTYRFSEIDAELPRVSIADPGREGEAYHVARLTALAQIQREPIRLVGLRGDLRRTGERLTMDVGRMELPDSRATGDVVATWSADGVVVDADLRVEPLALSELQWLLPRLPRALVRGPVGLRTTPDTAVLTFDGAELTTRETSVVARGAVQTVPELDFRDLRLELSPLWLPQLDQWLSEPLPVRGRTTGTLQLDGGLEALAVGGRLTLREEGVGPTTARVSGVVSLAGRRGVQGLQIDLEPLDYALLERLRPGLRMEGRGSLLLEADGWLDRGLSVVADLEHEAAGVSRSRLEAEGTIRTDSSDVHLDLRGEVDPVDLRALRTLAPELGLAGEVEGPVRVTGRLGELRVETELRTEEGDVALDARFDARNPVAGYRIDGELEELRLSDLLGSLPAPTTVSGSVSARGRGMDRQTLEGSAQLRLRSSRLARFEVDSAEIAVGVEGGSIRLDTLDAHTNLAHFRGAGRMALTEEGPRGRVRLSFRNDSLRTVRPLLLGDTVIAADTLSPLERDVLVFGGVDPDTLPTESSIALEGSLAGEVTLEGGIDDFSAEGRASIREMVYGSNFLRGADLTFSATGLPQLEGEFAGTLQADSVRWLERSFRGGRLELDYMRPGGSALLELERSGDEDYRVRVAFEADSLGGVIHLDELVLRFADVRWNLGGPATFEWSEEGLRVRDFRLIRPGPDGMRILADGDLPFRGAADFGLEVRRLRLGRVSGLLQTGEDVEGLVDLELTVGGTARDPVASGSLSADSLRFRNVTLSRMEGSVEYGERRLRGNLRAWRDSFLAGRIEVSYPVDLALQEREERILDEPMDVRVVTDSFPTVVLATFLETVEDVTGAVTGEVRFAGTPRDVRPSGGFRVEGGSFRLPALGIRPAEIEGTVELTEEDRARLDLQGRAGGQIRVQGTMELDPLTDPGFDLTIRADGFQAVARRDVQGRVSGQVTLAGTFTRPVVTGSSRVDEGVLRIEEFERSAEVVDLSDPRFFEVVDTAVVEGRSGLAQSPNPFLQNLRVEVDLQVQRSWLRSRNMNVEMAGNLIINWNRNTGDLVLTGQLSAVRGTYTQFNRQFQVQDGTIEFVGTPGLNPNLGIQAVTRLRTAQGEPLTIVADVSGTLQSPRLSLTSDAQPPIAESDLVSYLLFGRPSFVLGSGETALLQQSASQLLGAAVSRLGSAAIQEVGVDYFAVTQAPGSAPGSAAGLGSTVAGTQVEAGWYWGEDLFFSLLFRPLVGVGSTAASQDRLAGMRIEWQLGDVWTVQGFWEDRFSREQLVGFGDLAFRLSKIFGFFVYRDWGY